jgi:hypothetical protein
MSLKKFSLGEQVLGEVYDKWFWMLEAISGLLWYIRPLGKAVKLYV